MQQAERRLSILWTMGLRYSDMSVMLINILSEGEFELLGKILVVLLSAFTLTLFILLLVLLHLLRKEKIIHSNLLLYLIHLLYGPLTIVSDLFGVEPDSIDRIFIKLNNNLAFDEFKATDPCERVILLPQCMRDASCPAKLSPVDGFHCISCGRCQIGSIKHLCDDLNMKVFIVPGGSFAKRILKSYRPRAVVGVACFSELYEGLLNTGMLKIPAVGIPLIRDGCVGTAVDEAMLLDVILAGIDLTGKAKAYEEFRCHYMRS
ncbi:MAG TPA: DUF116 domain-containing protein [Candidatus Syntrophoarchaeum butanivorans]|uniref:DUF116 domain-containing protein n=2 Tax=Candidatus Syntropharchaeum butanivorans TaxID=1839936 RepID=A0A7J2S3H0_9EURY|nr:MAG: DUF116 domain-containing protein [Candidatus Syntrophoarchaeum sp. WYZ-LMO15]HEC57259.1 DUF116 domain-containing protein [Candidatus Syntrophoarchaeum butanivorans]